MSRHALGREQVHEAAWGRESYPHPMVSCMMPVGILLAIALLGLFGFTLWQKSLPKNVKVPQVKGVTLEVAEQRLRGLRLDVDVVPERRTSEKIPAGSILASIPPEGRFVKEGRTVRLLVSAGSLYTKVPDVVTMPLSTAREMLAKAKLVITREVAKYDEEIPIDSIIAITPKAGTKVQKGSEVKLVISKGSRADLDLGVGVDDTRSSTLLITVPGEANEPPAELRIEVTDDSGTRTVYRETHSPGDNVVENVEGTGETTAKVYFGRRLILTRTF